MNTMFAASQATTGYAELRPMQIISTTVQVSQAH